MAAKITSKTNPPADKIAIIVVVKNDVGFRCKLSTDTQADRQTYLDSSREKGTYDSRYKYAGSR